MPGHCMVQLPALNRLRIWRILIACVWLLSDCDDAENVTLGMAVEKEFGNYPCLRGTHLNL